MYVKYYIVMISNYLVIFGFIFIKIWVADSV